MKFWKRRKNKKNIDDFVEQMELETGLKESGENEHDVLERCEEILDTIRDLEEAKSEYRVVTDYLKDIQSIKDIPQEAVEELQEVAGNVAKLNRARDSYLHTTKKLSDAQFLQIQQDEKEIQDIIRRLETNEAYEAATKRDMNYLEGEKQQWLYCMDGVKDEMRKLRISSYVLFGIFVVLLAVVLVLQVTFDMDMKWIFTLLIAAMAIGGFSIYFRMQYDTKLLKQCEVNINHAISLSNKVKFKYVNTKNAVDYTCEKYHVHNSRELIYLWEQYQDMLKEKERYIQTNEDLEYYNMKLVRQLRQYQLYDAKVWVQNPQAICDAKEMVEVQHNLIARRQKLRERIEYMTASVAQMRKEVEGYTKTYGETIPELRKIIELLDEA